MSTVTNSSSIGTPRASGRSWRFWLLLALPVAGLAWVASSFLPQVGTGLIGAGADEAFYEVRTDDLVITLTEDGEVKPLKSIELKSEVEGRSTIRFLVEESTRVAKGDLLVELASDQLDERISGEEIELEKISSDLKNAVAELDLQRNQNASEIKKAESDLEIARKDLEKYTDGDYEKALKGIVIQIEETRLKHEQKTEDYEKNQDLNKRGFVTAAKLRQLALEIETLNLKLDQHLLSKSILDNYEKPMEIHRKETAVEQALDALERARKRALNKETQAASKVAQFESLLALRTDRLDRLKAQRDKCRIFAPTDGVVQYPTEGGRWGGDDQLAVGSQVSEGQTLVVLPDTSQMIVNIRIHEADRHKVAQEMQCLVKVPAVPNAAFEGKVAKIARFADSANRWLNPDLKEHTTEILLTNRTVDLSPGDSAEVEILVDRIAGALAIPVQCVYSRGARDFVFLRRNGTIEPAEVQLGPSNDSMVQVVHGVSPGDEVHLHPGDDLIALLPNAEAGSRQQPTPHRATPGRKPGVAAGHAKPGQSPAGAKPAGGKPPAAQPAAASEQAGKPAVAETDKAAETESVGS